MCRLILTLSGFLAHHQPAVYQKIYQLNHRKTTQLHPDLAYHATSIEAITQRHWCVSCFGTSILEIQQKVTDFYTNHQNPSFLDAT